MKFIAMTLASTVAVCAVPASAASLQTLSFNGTLQNGGNQSNGPFAPAGTYTDLGGKAYSVTLSYDPSLFVTSDFAINSCGSTTNVYCSFNLSATRTVKEVLTVNGVTRTYTLNAGSFGLNASGNDNFNFSFQGDGQSVSGNFSDGNAFYPIQTNVNNPTFSGFGDLVLSQAGTFNQSGTGFSIGANPLKLTAVNSPVPAVPEPATWAMLLVGFALTGAAMRTRRRLATVSYA